MWWCSMRTRCSHWRVAFSPTPPMYVCAECVHCALCSVVHVWSFDVYFAYFAQFFVDNFVFVWLSCINRSHAMRFGSSPSSSSSFVGKCAKPYTIDTDFAWLGMSFSANIHCDTYWVRTTRTHSNMRLACAKWCLKKCYVSIIKPLRGIM